VRYATDAEFRESEKEHALQRYAQEKADPILLQRRRERQRRAEQKRLQRPEYREKRNRRDMARRRALKNKGLCTQCGKRPFFSEWNCADCLDVKRDSHYGGTATILSDPSVRLLSLDQPRGD
jgi:hypothetical protein